MNFRIRASIKQLLTKYQIYTILPQNFTFSEYGKFFKYICNFLDQLLHPYKFYGRGMSGILFFHFCQLWTVKKCCRCTAGNISSCHVYFRSQNNRGNTGSTNVISVNETDDGKEFVEVKIINLNLARTLQLYKCLKWINFKIIHYLFGKPIPGYWLCCT